MKKSDIILQKQKRVIMIKIVSSLLSLLVLSTTLFAEDMAEKIKEQNQEVVKMAAKEINSQLPQTIDKYTQLMSVKGEDRSLIYTYEIKTGDKSDEEVIKEDKSRMQKAVTQGICNSSQRFLENGIDISYIYASAVSKKALFQFDVSQKDCAKK